MANANITADRLRELLDYDPNTGKFTAKIERRKGPKKWHIGEVVSGTAKTILIDGRCYMLSFLAWLHYFGKAPATRLVHVNGDRRDIRISNLRQRIAVAEINATFVRDVFSYDSETGIFTRNIRTSNRISIGDVAGRINEQGYVILKVSGKAIAAHRIAWLHFHGAWPGGEIDHINGVRNDNRIANLRVVDRTGNTQNTQGPRRDNSSGYMGVSPLPNGKWKASIQVNKRPIVLGKFDTPQEAHSAYLAAKRELHPTFSG